MNIKDFKPGQTVYEYNFRRNIIVERTVKSVGTKYVTVNGEWKTKYYKDEERNENYLKEKTDFGIEWFLFLSRQDIDCYVERNKIIQKINREMSNKIKKMTLKELKTIEEIMDSTSER